eukprot:5757180-Pleurochrysis_carterae.AAC.2
MEGAFRTRVAKCESTQHFRLRALWALWALWAQCAARGAPCAADVRRAACRMQRAPCKTVCHGAPLAVDVHGRDINGGVVVGLGPRRQKEQVGLVVRFVRIMPAPKPKTWKSASW